MLDSDHTLARKSGLRLRLEVTRRSPMARWSLDRTNLAGGSIKGIEDALVRAEYLVDDREEWLQGPFLRQEVSADGTYSTVIKLMLIQPDHQEAF